MRPFIAVVGRRSPRVAGLRFSATVAAEAVCDAVFRAGGEPVIFHGAGAPAVAELAPRLAGFHGALLPGGADLDPGRYGQAREAETEDSDALQDDLDLAVAAAVIAADIPTLAICRGLQVVNVACGGTLTQHLAYQEIHRNGLHDVVVEPGSRLSALTRATTIRVSSYHHQGVSRLGTGLRVTARSDDGCVEAVEHMGADLLAVQWHPEDLAATHAHDQALFDDLVERAGTRMEFAA